MGARLAFSLLLAGCTVFDLGTPPASPPPGGGPEIPTLARCTDRPFTPDAPIDWRNLGTHLTVALGSARHDAADALATTTIARGTQLTAKFTYGAVKKDLEGEWIRAYVDDCTGWSMIGDALTDGDGTAKFLLARELPPGRYDLRFVVRGDGTFTSATAWIFPEQTRLAVFDIDGTLTTDDSELILDLADSIYDGSYVAGPYAGAIDLVAAHDAIGHVPVYMTGRPRWLTTPTRAWLADQGAPAAPLVLAPGNLEALPTEGGVGQFKLQTILALADRGFIVDVAYGNASTDIYAYLGAGLRADATWIIGDHAGEQGTHDPGADWTARAAEVAAMADVPQPFTR